MTTGNFWDVDDPRKPFGEFDPDGVYDLPFDWASWLAGLAGGADTYGSHVASCEAGLSVVASAEVAGVITVRIKKDPLIALTTGRKYFVRCHIVTTNGQEEDQTLYLKVKEK